MQLVELFLLAVGLSMDAFAVSVCKGLAMPRAYRKAAVVTGLWFGGFQALMPLLGYLAGSSFMHLIRQVDHWIAFGLLAGIGINMLREAMCAKEETELQNADISFFTMLLLAVATSIDALAAGVSFAALQIHIVMAVCMIGCTTFVISAAGVVIGHLDGNRFRKSAEVLGGIILILIGVKILLEHLLGI